MSGTKEKLTKSRRGRGSSSLPEELPSKSAGTPRRKTPLNGAPPNRIEAKEGNSNGKPRKAALSHIFDFESLHKSAVAECCLCGGPVDVPIGNFDRYGFFARFVACRGCASVYITPRPSASDYAELYSSGKYRLLVDAFETSQGREPPSRTVEARNQRSLGKASTICQIFSRQLSGCRTALDIGGGNGAIAHALGAGVKTTIVDPADESPRDVQCERWHTPIESISDLKGQKWDVVFCLATLDHLIDPMSALRIVREAASQYAIVEIVDFPARFTKQNFLGLKIDHPVNFSQIGAEIAMDRAGLKRDHVHYFQNIDTVCYGCHVADPVNAQPRRGSAAHVIAGALGQKTILGREFVT